MRVNYTLKINRFFFIFLQKKGNIKTNIMKTAIINITTTDGKNFREEIEMTKMPNYFAFENIQTSLDEFFTDWKNLDKPMNIKNIVLESEMTGKVFYKGEF